MAEAYPQSLRVQAKKLYDEGWGLEKIASVLECAHTTVKRWIVQQGGQIRPAPGVEKVRKQEILNGYFEDPQNTIAGTARRYGVHEKTLSRWISRSGQEPHIRKRVFDREGIMEDLDSGLSGADVARKHGCSESFVSAVKTGKK